MPAHATARAGFAPIQPMLRTRRTFGGAPSYNGAVPLRIAAIDFLNPAPLLYDFEHPPRSAELDRHYRRHYTAPSECARELLAGEADLGLIPVASLTPALAVVPGCCIASRHEVRSILLLVKNPNRLTEEEALRRIRTVAADRASRSSQGYVRVLLAEYLGTTPVLTDAPADASAMLGAADAALLIGDPALLARENRARIDAEAREPLLWIDVATLWVRLTGLPWIAAVWAVRPEALGGDVSAARLIADLIRSRDAGLAHTEELVREWTPRIAVPPDTIRTYLTRNIYYHLDAGCLAALQLFRSLAVRHGILPPLGELRLLED